MLAAYDKLPKMCQREAAEKLNLSQTSLNRLLKNREAIEGQSGGDTKRRRSGKDPAVEAAVVKWIANAREKNAPLSGPLVKEKAGELAAKLGKSDFKATDGWFSRLKKREGIQQKKLHGEGQSADFVSREEWLENQWPTIRDGYFDENIWNADESGIFYRALPDSTLTFRHDSAKGSKKMKDRFTALFCSSMTGEKRKILVIGRFKHPRCFKRISQLPVDYDANKGGWMTSAIFTEWITSWNASLRRQNRKILFLCDNCSAHPKNLVLSNIKVVFIPPNTTSVLQPCDQGIIQTVKATYRREMCRQVLREIDTSNLSAPEIAKKRNILDSVLLLNEAWETIDPITIRNCWSKAGLLFGPHEKPLRTVSPPTFPDGSKMPHEFWNSWLSMDDNEQVASVLTDDEIVEDVRNSFEEVDPDVSDTHEDAEEDEEEIPPPTSREMLKAMATLEKGLLSRNFTDCQLLNKFKRAVNKAVDCELKQSTIEKFLISL